MESVFDAKLTEAESRANLGRELHLFSSSKEFVVALRSQGHSVVYSPRSYAKRTQTNDLLPINLAAIHHTAPPCCITVEVPVLRDAKRHPYLANSNSRL